jgi:hypothetical protein
MNEPVKKMFILYDGRARCGNLDEAGIFTSWEPPTQYDLPHAPTMRREAREFGLDSIWFEYDIAADNKTLINPRMRKDLS